MNRDGQPNIRRRTMSDSKKDLNKPIMTRKGISGKDKKVVDKIINAYKPKGTK